MRDRAKIVVNNREVGKRYLGNRLLWKKNTIRKELSYLDWGKIENIKRIAFVNDKHLSLAGHKITGLKINNSTIFNFGNEENIVDQGESVKQLIYILNVNSSFLNYLRGNGFTESYKKFNFTWYYEE